MTDVKRQLDQLAQSYTDCRAQLDSALRRAEENAAATRAAQEDLQYFVYAAGHDLQQPLRAIGTYAQLLERECPNNERAKELTAVIVDGAAQMRELIRDLVAFSRITQTSQRIPVDLNSSLQWALFNLAQTLKESGAQVTTERLPQVVADEKQMVTVFENLVSNSIKYRSAETPKVEIAGETGDEVHTISVRDNGIGIKPEYHERIFEPFKRLHTKEMIPGSGLGLSICRKIVLAHQGKIWVESDGERGSTFKFTVPV